MKAPPPWVLRPEDIKKYPGEIAALRALAEGGADEYQQRMVLPFIQRVLCQADVSSYCPGGEDGRRATDFAEGKRWVWLQLRRILNMVPDQADTRGEPPPMPMAREAT